MVMKRYLGCLSLKTGAAITGIFCVLYYGALGGYAAFSSFVTGPQYGLAFTESVLNYGQLAACLLLFISGILLILGAFGDCPNMSLMFLICGGVYTLWCGYMSYVVIEYMINIGFKVDVGFNVIWECLIMLYSWVAVLSYIMDEDIY